MTNETKLVNRASFMARFANQPQEHQWLIRKSYDEAKNGHGHAKQFRKDGITRYFVHPRMVALYAADKLGITHPTIICSALKHDCGEDTSIDGNITEGYFEWQNYAEFINTRAYDKQMAWIIIFMTKPTVDGIDFNSKKEVYNFYINRFKTVVDSDDEIESARKKAIFMKMLDRKANLSDMSHLDKSNIEKQIKETEEVYLEIFQSILDIVDDIITPKMVKTTLDDILEELSALKQGISVQDVYELKYESRYANESSPIETLYFKDMSQLNEISNNLYSRDFKIFSDPRKINLEYREIEKLKPINNWFK